MTDELLVRDRRRRAVVGGAARGRCAAARRTAACARRRRPGARGGARPRGARASPAGRSPRWRPGRASMRSARWMLLVVVARGASSRSRRRRRYLATRAAERRACGPATAGRYWALLLWFLAGLAAVPLIDNLGPRVGRHRGDHDRVARCSSASRATAGRDRGGLEVPHPGLGGRRLRAPRARCSRTRRRWACWARPATRSPGRRLMAIAPQLDPGLVRLAFMFALVGYGTKVGLAPFHTWLPDAHSQAPSPVAALLSGATLAVALYALARFHLVAAGALGPAFSSTLLVVFGLLSLAVALPFMVAQGDVKRLLAYSLDRAHGARGAGARLRRPARAGWAGAPPAGATAWRRRRLFLSAGRLVDAVGHAPARPAARQPRARAGRRPGVRRRRAAALRAAAVGAVRERDRDHRSAASRRAGARRPAIAALLLALAVAGLPVPRRARRGPAGDRRAVAAGPPRRTAPARSRGAGARLVGVPLASWRSLGCGRPPPLPRAHRRRSSRSSEAAVAEPSRRRSMPRPSRDRPLPRRVGRPRRAPAVGGGRYRHAAWARRARRRRRRPGRGGRRSAARTGRCARLRADLPLDDPTYPSLTPARPGRPLGRARGEDLLGHRPGRPPGPAAAGAPRALPATATTRCARTCPRGVRPPVADAPLRCRSTAQGEGIYQLPVGPIHAGVIEPGHFRFSAVGERVLHLDARLFFTHRGLEKLVEGRTFAAALPHRGAGLRRVHGDPCAGVLAGGGGADRDRRSRRGRAGRGCCSPSWSASTTTSATSATSVPGSASTPASRGWLRSRSGCCG